MRGTDCEHRSAQMMREVNGLYDKRWGEVLKFCLQVAARVSVLEQVWDVTKFSVSRSDLDDVGHDYGDSGASAFSPSDITKVLKDPEFHAYLSLVTVVNQTMEELVAWLEQCPCHEHLQSRYRSYTGRGLASRVRGSW